jgi:hypothetical protein
VMMLRPGRPLPPLRCRGAHCDCAPTPLHPHNTHAPFCSTANATPSRVALTADPVHAPPLTSGMARHCRRVRPQVWGSSTNAASFSPVTLGNMGGCPRPSVVRRDSRAQAHTARHHVTGVQEEGGEAGTGPTTEGCSRSGSNTNTESHRQHG